MEEKRSMHRKVKGVCFTVVMYAAAGGICLLLLGLIGYIVLRGVPSVTVELLTTKPSLVRETIGILPNILNTLYLILMTLLLVIPLGVGAAIYLREYSRNHKAVRVIELATETLAGIPSIVYGLVGMLLFVQFFSLGTSLIAGALTLVMLTLPTVIRTTQESLKTVPQGYREGALALGSGKWHMIYTVVLPSAMDGIVTGCILSVGRIVGESAALLFTAGMANEILGLFEAPLPGRAGSTLTVALYMYAKERGEFSIAFAIAFLLLMVTLLMNLAAKAAGRWLKKERRNR